jgi:hypothetical protein
MLLKAIVGIIVFGIVFESIPMMVDDYGPTGW